MLVHTCIFLFMVVNGDQTSCCVWNNESASFVRRIYSVFMSKTVSFMSKPCQFFFEIKENIFKRSMSSAFDQFQRGSLLLLPR